MSTVKQVVGTRTSVTATGLATLASATYVASADIDNTVNGPLDLLVEVAITPGTVSGNKQALIFAKGSLDGSNWQSGPESGTTSTNEPDLTYLGCIPLGANATSQMKILPVAGAFGGILPPHVKIVVKNDSGAAFTAGTINVSEVSGTVA